MLKEIKKGQQAAPKILTQQPNTSQQMPVKHCGICSCNSHYTDECPQLKKDNTVASSHNFYEVQPLPPQNKQYYTQPQSQPQNPKNPRYQPPHIRQTYPPNSQVNTFPPTYKEALRTSQQENKETRESQERTENQLTNLTDLLTKFANPATINHQPPSQLSSSSPLPSQPLSNPKGGINMVHNVESNGDEEDEEEGDDWLYELLVELANSNNSDKEEDCEEVDDEEEEAEEEDEDETFFIATVYGGNKAVKEEIPAKCADPGPCLVTCKIRGIEIPECMCDPGACGSVMPFELYETLDLKPLKKSNEMARKGKEVASASTLSKTRTTKNSNRGREGEVPAE
ncbi:hypothetical protein PIB30_053785 [Stylosanthes scabra]|uniref:Uncharacterized protein n=1 Tax=Stylosanthes scabra TaxID=79078 RepID=A0ABU6VKK8_9FABA|nr:hypothetical protein [Stylosanthes scabra]